MPEQQTERKLITFQANDEERREIEELARRLSSSNSYAIRQAVKIALRATPPQSEPIGAQEQ